MTTLLLSSRATPDSQQLWRAAITRGWDVERTLGPRLPIQLLSGPVVIYHEALFAPLIAEQLGTLLIDPPENWLSELPAHYAQRWIQLTTMGTARQATSPQFVKPPNDKSFAAQVYDNGLELPSDPEDSCRVLVAEPVQWQVEFRCFVADRKLATMSPYIEEGILLSKNGFRTRAEYVDAAYTFANNLLADQQIELPKAVVMDIGLIKNRGWAVVELNPAYSSGIYGCDADAVLDVLAHAIISRSLTGTELH